MTVRVYRVNTDLKTILWQQTGTDRKIANEAGVDNDTIKAGENIVKTRCGRIIMKPDRLMYQ